MAQIRTRSGLDDSDKELCMRVRIEAVMGSLTFGVAWRESLARVTPAKTLFSIGREDWSRGSGRPRESCTLRTAER